MIFDEESELARLIVGQPLQMDRGADCCAAAALRISDGAAALPVYDRTVLLLMLFGAE